MHAHYKDILSRIEDPALWFDEVAVPRFEPFSTRLLANIYAREAALVRIECQACRTGFDVAFTSLAASRKLPEEKEPDSRPAMIRDHIAARSLHYGDPPNIGCCGAGATMNSVPRRVLEYWVKPYALGEGFANPQSGKSDHLFGTISDPKAMDWRREPEFEIDITPRWAL
ncbi:MAG: hypothetical protein AAGF53_07720 [Pseudomonadota bacterium]